MLPEMWARIRQTPQGLLVRQYKTANSAWVTASRMRRAPQNTTGVDFHAVKTDTGWDLYTGAPTRAGGE